MKASTEIDLGVLRGIRTAPLPPEIVGLMAARRAVGKKERRRRMASVNEKFALALKHRLDGQAEEEKQIDNGNHQQKGTHMRHALIVFVLAAATLLIATTPAQAMYRDGMNVYQYVRSQPTRYVDWNGAQAAEPTPPPQTPVTAALYGDYPAEGSFAGWGAKVAPDRNYKIAVGADVINGLKEASKQPPDCCIKKLFIFHHEAGA